MTVVVTVKLLLVLLPCGVVGLDHRGGGGGGVLVESLFRLFLRVSTVLLLVVSILLSKFKVLGRVGFSPFVTYNDSITYNWNCLVKHLPVSLVQQS